MRAFYSPYGVKGKHDGCRKEVPLRRFESGYGDNVTTKTEVIMKEFIDILMSEDKSLDGFPWWMYAIVIPTAFILLAAIVGSL